MKKLVSLTSCWRKPNGNIAIIAKCPYCNYNNYIIISSDQIIFEWRDTCEHFDELDYDDNSELPAGVWFEFMQEELD